MLDDGAAPGAETNPPSAAAPRPSTRQRPLALIVVVAAVLAVIGITGGPWAQTQFGGEDGLEVQLDPGGQVRVESDDEELLEQYRASDNQAARAALRASIPGSTADLAQVLAVLAALIGAVGLWRDLTSHTWVLVAALALGTLVSVVILRDDVITSLANHTASTTLGDGDTSPTAWGALAVAGAAAAALAAAFASGPRPADLSLTTPPAPPRRSRWRARTQARDTIPQ